MIECKDIEAKLIVSLLILQECWCVLLIHAGCCFAVSVRHLHHDYLRAPCRLSATGNIFIVHCDSHQHTITIAIIATSSSASSSLASDDQKRLTEDHQHHRSLCVWWWSDDGDEVDGVRSWRWWYYRGLIMIVLLVLRVQMMIRDLQVHGHLFHQPGVELLLLL